LLAFEVPSSTEWAFQQCEPTFRADVFMDVQGTIETKIKAMELYAGEMRPFPHPRSAEALRAIARRWGSVVGVEYAEVFSLVRAVR
jgi:LmbE family N-acetylglucosaminyl deacetylase